MSYLLKYGPLFLLAKLCMTSFLYAQMPGTTPFAFLKKPVAISCSGTVVGGYCWYLGAVDESCDTVCSSRGGCNLAGTRNYAGSGGSNANCQAVMTALGTSGSWNTTEANASGCYVTSDQWKRGTDLTNCSGNTSHHARACACNN